FVASVSRQPGAADPISGAQGDKPVMAFVTSPSAVHATGMVAALMSTADSPVRSAVVPATQPLAEVVERPNASQPAVLTGYASMLVRLAAEASAGRLRIAPAGGGSPRGTGRPEMGSGVRGAFGRP